MNILLFSSHWPIDSELSYAWIESGHTVYFVARPLEWNRTYESLPQNVIEGLPNRKVKIDFILVGNHHDALQALKLKAKRFWLKTPILFVHWWFPFKDKLLPFVKNVCVTEYEKKFLMELQGISSEVVYCPVDTEFFSPNNDYKVKKKAIIIGNGFKERGIMGYDHLINILNLVHSKEPEIELKVIGKNEQKDFPNYVKVEYQNKSGLLKEISESSCVFFTTIKNLIMNSLQISMSTGKEVVVFDSESFREVIIDGKSGYLIKELNDEEFANRIITTVNNPNERVGKNAREVMIAKCSRKLVSNQLISIALSDKLGREELSLNEMLND